MRKFAFLALVALFVVGCAQSTEEDRRALIGKWLPEDGAKGHVEFKPDGVFDYFHGMATLRLGWKLGRKGRVDLLDHQGNVARTCYYTITDDVLKIDNGSGDTCVSPGITPPSPMPLTLKRAPAA